MERQEQMADVGQTPAATGKSRMGSWISHVSAQAKRLNVVGSRVVDHLLPGTCLTCDRAVHEQGGLCASCWSQMRFIAKPMCPVMGTPFTIDMGEAIISAEAIADPPPFSRLRSVVLYDDRARRLVAGLKFADLTNHARWMGAWMAVAGKELLEAADIIVPVPLHKRRLIERRYNQSADLARHLCLSAGIADRYRPQTLIRIRSTRQQVGLSMRERDRNVSGAFQVPTEKKIDVQGRRVVLVDDVYTTGATLRAATRALKRAGAREVMGLTFAKVETRDL